MGVSIVSTLGKNDYVITEIHSNMKKNTVLLEKSTVTLWVSHVSNNHKCGHNMFCSLKALQIKSY